MPILDSRTLFFICTSLIFIYGIGMLVFARKVSTSFNGIYLFAIANILIAIGFLLVFLRGIIDIFWSIIVANNILFVALILIYHAHLRFISHTKYSVFIPNFLLIISISLFLFFTYLVPSTNTRMIVQNILCIILFSLIIKYLYQHQKQYKTDQHYTAFITIYISWVIVLVARTIKVAFTEEFHPYNLADGTVFYSVIIILVMLYVIALDFFIILIATQLLIEKLSDLAYKDPMTMFYNRRGLDYKIENKNHLKLPLTIILCDLDHFKKINDIYGHAIGDIVIKNFSTIVTKSIRKTDICVRWGGEEFLIILQSANQYQAFNIAEKIRIACQQHVFSEQIDLTFTCSFGVFEKIEDCSFDTMIKNADLALYKAKEMGRNRTYIFTQKMLKST